MMNSIKFFCLIFFLTITWHNPVYSETIVAGVGEWQPWTKGTNKNTGEGVGILVEIFNTAVRQAGHQPVIRICPQVRRNFEWGRLVDAELGVIPEWREGLESVSVYTIPIVRTVDIIIAKKGKITGAKTIKSFYGKSLGTNLGYVYTDGFNEAFKTNKIKRDDTSSEGSSIIKKLVSGRFDAAILDRHEARYWLKKMNLNIADYEEVYEFKTISNLRIRLHKNKTHLVKDINKALKKMKDDGTIKNITDKYL